MRAGSHCLKSCIAASARIAEALRHPARLLQAINMERRDVEQEDHVVRCNLREVINY